MCRQADDARWSGGSARAAVPVAIPVESSGDVRVGRAACRGCREIRVAPAEVKMRVKCCGEYTTRRSRWTARCKKVTVQVATLIDTYQGCSGGYGWACSPAASAGRRRCRPTGSVPTPAGRPQPWRCAASRCGRGAAPRSPRPAVGRARRSSQLPRRLRPSVRRAACPCARRRSARRCRPARCHGRRTWSRPRLRARAPPPRCAGPVDAPCNGCRARARCLRRSGPGRGGARRAPRTR